MFLAACGETDTTLPVDDPQMLQAVNIVARDLAFEPSSIDAEAGEGITFIFENRDNVEHSFTIDDVVDVEAPGGEEARDTFTVPDSTVEFYCRYHPDQMRGEVIVGGSSGADTGGGGMMDDQDLDY